MIIVLKDADFSENNIGKIVVPVELHEFTKKILTKCTAFAMDSQQAHAINDFIIDIDNAGVLEHLGFLMCPWLASTKAEAMYDIVNDYQYDNDNYTFDAAAHTLVDTAYRHYTNYNTPLQTKNFFGLIKNTSGQSHLSVYGNEALVQFGAWLTLGISTSGPGYQVRDASEEGVNNSRIYLMNVKGLSNLDSNGSNGYLNGVSSVVDIVGNYDKSGEPLNSTLVKFSPWKYAIQYIFFAGDGTNLTDEQVTAVSSAMKILSDTLVGLQG